ncbi:MAG: hypothetical protein ACFFD8_02360 [Candidatus Thorarchaeota archaeon]
MTSPTPELAKEKLGQYLEDSRTLREKKQYKEALALILVSGEYYWRKHQHTRAAGLLLEACDLFYHLQTVNSCQTCLIAALELISKKAPLIWWENELLGTIFLFKACLTILTDSNTISEQIRNFREKAPKNLQSQISREDGYRVAVALKQAVKRESLSPIDDLDTKTTLRSRSDYTTLHEYLMGLAERYVLIGDCLRALRRETQQEAL